MHFFCGLTGVGGASCFVPRKSLACKPRGMLLAGPHGLMKTRKRSAMTNAPNEGFDIFPDNSICVLRVGDGMGALLILCSQRTRRMSSINRSRRGAAGMRRQSFKDFARFLIKEIAYPYVRYLGLPMQSETYLGAEIPDKNNCLTIRIRIRLRR